MLVNRTFIETLINYVHCSSKDDTRPFLESVYIEYVCEDEIKLKSTDGYKLIESIHKVENCPEFTGLILSKIDINQLKPILKECKDVHSFELNIDNVTFELVLSSTTIKFKGINKDYPRTENIKPIKFTSQENICFNPDFVTDLRKAVYGGRKISNTQPMFNFKFSGDLNPLMSKVVYNSIEHILLLMPVRA